MCFKRIKHYIALELPHLTAPLQILIETNITVWLQTDWWNQIKGFIIYPYLGNKWHCIRGDLILQPIYSFNKFVEQQY